MKNNIVTHDSGMTSYNLNLLNDRQRISLFETFDSSTILHIGISDNKTDCKVLTKEGVLYRLEFSLINLIKSIKL